MKNNKRGNAVVTDVPVHARDLKTPYTMSNARMYTDHDVPMVYDFRYSLADIRRLHVSQFTTAAAPRPSWKSAEPLAKLSPTVTLITGERANQLRREIVGVDLRTAPGIMLPSKL